MGQYVNIAYKLRVCDQNIDEEFDTPNEVLDHIIAQIDRLAMDIEANNDADGHSTESLLEWCGALAEVRRLF